MLPNLKKHISDLSQDAVPPERKPLLAELANYIQQSIRGKGTVNLNFICTHNSRRSQLAQIWAQTAAHYFNIPVKCFSGGVEVTAFNHRAVAALERAGFKITRGEGENPVFRVEFADEAEPVLMFSKLFDDPTNQADQFAAIMTCSDADENCPFIPGTEKRIPVHYEDPKSFDDTPEEEAKYDERSRQIANEMFYVFSKITR